MSIKESIGKKVEQIRRALAKRDFVLGRTRSKVSNLPLDAKRQLHEETDVGESAKQETDRIIESVLLVVESAVPAAFSGPGVKKVDDPWASILIEIHEEIAAQQIKREKEGKAIVSRIQDLQEELQKAYEYAYDFSSRNDKEEDGVMRRPTYEDQEARLKNLRKSLIHIASTAAGTIEYINRNRERLEKREYDWAEAFGRL